MTKTSDPARDFTDLCLRLRSQPVKIAGASFLASEFEVTVWATDFMLILASIHQRIDALRSMIGGTDLDEDLKRTASDCLEAIRRAFTIDGLTNQWEYSVLNHLTDAHLTPVRMTSGYVRLLNGYEVPDDAELAEIITEIEALIGWLSDINLTDKDFIRESLIEGLQGFLFRISRVGYFGWPDAFESLKAVITAYMALERGMPDPNASPPYEAAAKKVSEFLLKTFERVKFTKEATEVGDWLLRGYGALQAIGHAQPAIAGLLTHAGG